MKNNRILRWLSLGSLVLSVSSANLYALSKSELRYCKRYDITLPTGQFTVSEALERISELNPSLPLSIEPSQDQRRINLLGQQAGRTTSMGLDKFVKMFKTKIPDFEKSFSWDIGKQGVTLRSLQATAQLHESFSPPSWVADLPTMDVEIVSDSDASLKTGNYTKPVNIKGDLELKGQKFAFKELKLEGDLKLDGQQITGQSFTLAGKVEISNGSEARFQTITTDGSLEMKSGSKIIVKDIVLGKGDLILGEGSDLILN